MKLNVLKENIASLEFTDEKFLIVKAQILKANHGMIYLMKMEISLLLKVY